MNTASPKLRLRVLALAPTGDADCSCVDEDGVHHIVDFLTGGTLPDTTDPRSLIGAVIEVDGLKPHIEIAIGARVLP